MRTISGFFLPFLYFLLLPFSSNAQYLVGYHQNWDDVNAPYIDLDQIDSRYTVVNLAFPTTQAGTDYDMTYTPCCGETQAGLISKIQTLQANGVKVNLSIGGATIPIHLDNTNEINTFVSSMNSIIATYGLDGVDIDLEGSSLSVTSGTTIANPTDTNIVNMIDAIQQIMANYQATNGTKMFLSAAPETAFVQGGQGSYGGIWGAYLPLLEALRTDMDLLHVQLYNSGSMFGLDGNIYAQSTADFIVSQTEAVIAGFTAAGGAGSFIGFNESQVSVGLPACPSAAGGGYTTPATVKAAIDYLLGVGPKPGSYTLQGGPYPNLGGMMTWSVNWDVATGCNSTAYEFASSYEDIFGSAPLCQQPNLGNDLSACNLSFPYTLDSNTPTNTDVTFTWKNVSTGQTLVNAVASSSTFNISAAGTYRVERDSMGCSKFDEITISNTLDAPDIPVSENLCAVIPFTLNPTNTASFPAGTNFQWHKDNSPISGETNSSLSNIRETGDYKLTAQSGACNSENTTTITSGAPMPIDGCADAGNTVELSISSSSSGPFSWSASPGGSVLSTGMTFTTPPLNNTTTYYVKDESSLGEVTTGPSPTANGLGTLQNSTGPSTIIFDAAETFTLEEITVYPQVFCYTHTFSIEIQNAAGIVLTNGTQSMSVVDDTDCSNVTGAHTMVFSGGGVEIPQGTGYKIVQTGNIGLNHWEGSVSYPMNYSPFFTITGVNAGNGYPAIHDWKVAGGSCAEMPVIAEIDPACASALPVELINFSAVQKDKKVYLTWETENERENAGFQLQRSQDARNFQDVAWQDARDNERNFYDYLDTEIQFGKTYHYRLKQVDLNGDFTYSSIKSISLKGEVNSPTLYPNPAQNILFTEWNVDNYTLKIYNAQGQLVFMQKMSNGLNSVGLDDLAAGIYLVKLQNGMDEFVEKLVVQE